MQRLLGTLLLAVLLGCGASAPDPQEADAANRKQVFDGMLHTNRPDLYGLYGFRYLNFINPVNQPYLTGLWPDLTTAAPEAWMDALAANYTHPDNMLILDMESYPIGTQQNRLDAAAKMVLMVQGMKARRPELKIGFYAYPHIGSFTRVIGDVAANAPGGANYITWQGENDDFAALWAVVDYIFPTLYFPYTRAAAPSTVVQPYIHNYFHENIAETIRGRTAYGHNQPIIPYVWYQTAAEVDIDLDVWDDMIRTAYTEADGMILWSKNTAPAWDENLWWWRQFKAKFPFGDRQLIQPRTPIGQTVLTPPAVDTRTMATETHLTTSITWNHVNGASLNPAVVASVAYNDSETPTWTATYCGAAMTLVTNYQVSSDGVAAFILTNPPGGTCAVVISAGATTITDMQGFSMSFQGVNQLTPTRAVYTGFTAATGPSPITVANTQKGDLVVTVDILGNLNMRVDLFQDMSVTRDTQIGSSSRSAVMATRYAYGSNTSTGILIATAVPWRGLAFALIPYGGS